MQSIPVLAQRSTWISLFEKFLGAVATGKFVIYELVSYEPAPDLFRYLIGKCLCQLPNNPLQIVAPESSLRLFPTLHFYPISIVQDGSIKANKFEDALDRPR